MYTSVHMYGHSGGVENMIDPMKDPKKLREESLKDLSPRDRDFIDQFTREYKEQLKWPKDR